MRCQVKHKIKCSEIHCTGNLANKNNQQHLFPNAVGQILSKHLQIIQYKYVHFKWELFDFS